MEQRNVTSLFSTAELANNMRAQLVKAGIPANEVSRRRVDELVGLVAAKMFRGRYYTTRKELILESTAALVRHDELSTKAELVATEAEFVIVVGPDEYSVRCHIVANYGPIETLRLTDKLQHFD